MSVYHDFTSYCNALSNWLNTSGKIIDGEGYAIVRNELVSDEEFFAHNSRPEYQPVPRDNYDKSGIAPDKIIKQRGRRLKP